MRRRFSFAHRNRHRLSAIRGTGHPHPQPKLSSAFYYRIVRSMAPTEDRQAPQRPNPSVWMGLETLDSSSFSVFSIDFQKSRSRTQSETSRHGVRKENSAALEQHRWRSPKVSRGVPWSAGKPDLAPDLVFFGTRFDSILACAETTRDLDEKLRSSKNGAALTKATITLLVACAHEYSTLVGAPSTICIQLYFGYWQTIHERLPPLSCRPSEVHRR